MLRENKICGIVAESDLYRVTIPGITKIKELSDEIIPKLEKYQVEEVMKEDPVTCTPNTPLEHEATHMVMMRIVGEEADEFIKQLWKSDY